MGSLQCSLRGLPQDFTQVHDFDGMALAARCLVRLCENGNLTVAAELIQAGENGMVSSPLARFFHVLGRGFNTKIGVQGAKLLGQAKADVNMPEPDIGVTPLIAAPWLVAFLLFCFSHLSGKKAK